MMTFFIEAKVTIRVRGISGPWEIVCGYMVDAPTAALAKIKFENQVRRDHANMETNNFKFEYLRFYSHLK